MQTTRIFSSITRYVSRSTFPKVVRPSTMTMRRPFSTAEGQEKGPQRPQSWFNIAYNDILSPAKVNLSYEEKLDILRQAAPQSQPTNYLILRNLAFKTPLADIRRILPKVLDARDTRSPHVLLAKFATVEDAQHALDVVNSATEYPFSPVTRPAPAFAEFSDLSAAFESPDPTEYLHFPVYHGTIEQLQTILAPFVPAGHELKVFCRDAKAWARLGSTEAAQAAVDALSGQPYSVDHVIDVRYSHPKDSSKA